MRKCLVTISAALGLLAFAAGNASAADLDQTLLQQAPELPMTKPVEVGTGWYLRGDLAYNISKDDVHSNVTTVGPLSSSSDFSIPTSSFAVTSVSKDTTPISGSIGFGYHFNDYLRADIDVGVLSMNKSNYESPGSCEGTTTITNNATGAVLSTQPGTASCDSNIAVQTNVWYGMLNGYFDLGTYAGLTPYVGAGVGFAYAPVKFSTSATCKASQTSNGTTTTTFLCDGQSSASDASVNYAGSSYKNNSFSFAYALSAGFAYQMTKNLSLDVGYQYIDAPNAQYAAVGDSGPYIGKGLSYQQVKVGLRYDIW